MFCSKCGQQNPEDAKFCFKCGSPFNTEAGQVPVPPSGEATGTAPVVIVKRTSGFSIASLILGIFG